MKKTFTIASTLLLSMSLFGCSNTTNTSPEHPSEQASEKPKEPQEAGQSDKKLVTNIVEEFGKKLQMVSLLAPKKELKKNMTEQYGGLVAKPLLEKWINNPEGAPGRQTSSPWPERIEILSVEKATDASYKVKGEIIEITSVEKEKGGFAAKQPIDLTVKKRNNDWLITDVTLGEYAADGIQYKNTDYGFEISLPESWMDYQILTDKWEGMSPQSGKVIETGPLLPIRHPQWTKQNPRQDIPVMVFTHEQWDAMQEEKFHIGAAPMNPKELGRNADYVFALPARYNFAFPTGYEEVEKILNSEAFKVIEEK
ncbi:hypothetical protein F7731_21040 [Cytobacillus depressus]|uniref:DUF4878 domain-containing protein n=1 Tax=Cytobacillus depressus TaxID=1602942 RepID=A0A6L3V5S7_9BACI|nr:hypothetical protein [Cytobacillus depressus]KAB2329951.1 hypothetical protein F7731_21040 [Cytobacillus depressus]